MDLLYFILLISVLIFVHESGHFAFAKIFGVKVITFSIGFGPKILRLRGKETEYCVSLLPFGGFVKMLEQSKHDEPLLPEERHRTFEAQALWKRVVIVLAGPAMNVLFPIVLFSSVYLEDKEFLAPRVGVLLPGSPAEGKLQPGDRILAIDGEPVTSYPDVQALVSVRANKPTRFTVQRDSKVVETTITPVERVVRVEPEELEIEKRVGRIELSPRLPAAVVGVVRQSPAWRAGLRTFDRITAINGRKVESQLDLVSLLSANRGETVVLTYLRPVDVPNAMGGLCDIAVMEPGVAPVTPLPRSPEAAAPHEWDYEERAADVLARVGIESADMYVAFVPEGSSEWRAGLRPGDRITTLDGRPQKLWLAMEAEIVRGANQMHELGWTRDGEPMKGFFQVRKEQWDDELGQHYERYVFRTTHWMPHAPDVFVPNPSPWLYAIRHGFEETRTVVQYISVGVLRILQGKVSLSSVSGPITMYDIAGRAGAKGTEYFVWAMALISVNLGLINLLPIPVLDGGHLFFLLIEAIRRRPISIRVREVASLVGVVMLLLLMTVAFKNDVERRWDVIKAQVKEIVS